VSYVAHYVLARLLYDGLLGTGIPPIVLLALVLAGLLLWRRAR
jgi:hypothetical protein